jgi:hypothetical protein
MENQIINIDSRFRDLISQPNSGSFKHKLATPLKHISTIRISSVEFPNIYNICTAKKENINFKIIDGTGTYNIVITEGSYTSDLLLYEVNRIFTALAIPYLMTFNEITSKITIKNITAPTPLNFSLDFSQAVITPYYSLGYMMGFTKATYTGFSSYSGDLFLNITGDNYLFLNVNNYGASFSNNQKNTTNYLAKIILNKNKANIIYDNSSNFISKEYVFRQPVNLTELNIEVLDPHGNIIDLGTDFSFTIEAGFIYNSELRYKLNNNI